ncbi:glycosyltransferase [Marinimicrobium agarilyticum]|uniref:glycosyltransferase n=1 Tax=Marinimicrobium agarilyticum TaxID=306546 RepID=UPI0003FE658D|nr:glycosyltransferase family 4 protein [Marinimicrobium agarilyticum]
MKHLVILGSVWPEPQSSAAGTRMCQLMDLFQDSGWSITFASAALPSAHRIDLKARSVQEAEIALNSDEFEVWLAEQQPDAVLFDRFMTEEQFGWRVSRTCPDALRLLDTEDLHCLRAARWEIMKARSGGNAHTAIPVIDDRRALYERMVELDITQRELASIYRSDLSLMVSSFEVALLREEFGVPAALLHTLPIFAKPTTSPGFEQRRHFISIGNFRHAPNWDAVLWLKQDLWPRIRASLPDAELHVVGAYPPPKATVLENRREGFLIKGWVEDALATMAHSRVCLAPLRFGAGIKGKLLDAMATGTPSVTTAIGAEAMASVDQWPGRVENTSEAICEAAVNLYQNERAWRLAQAGAARVLTHGFSRERYQSAFAHQIRVLEEGLKAHRKANFVGAMLRHHHHRSTQYMSQWIEAKTRLQQHTSTEGIDRR